MGAGASVENAEALGDQLQESERQAEKVADGLASAANKVDDAASAYDQADSMNVDIPNAVAVAGDESVESPEAVVAEVEAVLAKIPDEQIAGQCAEMFEKCGEHMTSEEMKGAVDVVGVAIAEAGEIGGVMLVTVGSALNECADMAPAVIAVVSDSLIVIGPHLPVIGIAAGALGCLANTYQASKKDDQFVATFVIWCGGVKDWLILVAGRVSTSGGENTLAMFEALKDKLIELKDLLDEQTKRHRITKMLTSGTFNKQFDACKTFVLDLKSALKDYLDQEACDKQEAMLESVVASNIRVEEKLDGMSDDMTAIKAMLEKQAADKAAEDANKLTGTEEEMIYAQIQDSVGVERTASISFKNLVMAFQTFFCGNKKLPPEVKRGLKISIDEEDTGIVTKLQWIGFYRAWQQSEQKGDMFEYLLVVADNAPPTLFGIASDASNRASRLMGSGTFKLSDKYSISAAKDAAKDAANAAASLGSSMMSSGMSMLGSMSPGKSKTAPEAAAAPTDPTPQ